jgi:hypothetical protein
MRTVRITDLIDSAHDNEAPDAPSGLYRGILIATPITIALWAAIISGLYYLFR